MNIKFNEKQIKFNSEEKKVINKEIKDLALKVISKKGATIFAPAKYTADLVETILYGSGEEVICSVVLNGEYGLRNISIGVPIKLGSKGFEEILKWNLDNEEKKIFYRGAEKLQNYIKKYF